MIAALKGTVLLKREKSLILDVHDVGYEVYVTRTNLEKVAVGDSLSLFIYTNVREDDISLFGHTTQSEITLFKLLITVSGIGPRVALEVMTAPLTDLQNAIAHKDIHFLTRIPGIGKKIAERMCVELSAKVAEIAPTSLNYKASLPDDSHDEIVHALTSLGYTRSRVVQGLKKIPDDVKGEEAIIKYFLQHSL